ncbi:MAG TPA: PPOX class F420-dependent oxidoreductase [Blastocatellia bacterium]|nr:PPOX class F420-dependent oxidoreductase [Blastocatellia bacterium]
MSEDKLAQFANQKYINLQTFKRDGTPVATPVWFAERGDELIFYTSADSGKVKRLRNNPHVRIAVCDARGNLKGEWVEAEVRRLDAAEGTEANRLITKKYGLIKRVMDFFTKLTKSPRATFAIHVH